MNLDKYVHADEYIDVGGRGLVFNDLEPEPTARSGVAAEPELPEKVSFQTIPAPGTWTRARPIFIGFNAVRTAGLIAVAVEPVSISALLVQGDPRHGAWQTPTSRPTSICGPSSPPAKSIVWDGIRV